MFLVFFLVWVVLNERLTVEVAIFGIIISALLSLFMHRFIIVGKRPQRGLFFRLFPDYISYFFGALIPEIIKANIQTIKIVFSRKEPEPVLVHFRADLDTGVSRVALANSITLTPGTITAALAGNHYVVHCLDKSMSAGLDDSSFVHRLKRMEAKSK